MSKSFITLDEAVGLIQEISNDEDESALIILPPDTRGEVTDEEEDDEDLNECQELKEVAGNVEVFHPSLEDTHTEELPCTSAKAKRKKKEKIAWKKNEKIFKSPPQPTPISLEKTNSELLELFAFQLFRLYFDEDVNNLAKRESERYAKQKLNHQFYLPQSDLDAFLGTILLSGYHTLPQEHLYWCNNEDVGVNIVKKKISRNRFQEIKRYFHLADNDNLQQSDKLAKVRTYLNLMQRNFLRFGVFSEHLSIDEQMVPYYGHFSTKMFMRNKPVKFGMKIWFLASAQGYQFGFDVYTGKDISSSEPLGERVVNKLTAVLENYSNHAIFLTIFLVQQPFAEI